MKRGKFSLSHTKLATMNMGHLVPIGLMEVLPGDTVQQATSALIRVSPLVAPVMHPVHVRIHHWYVPVRLIWDDFEKFITGGPDGMDASVYPTIQVPGGSGASVGSLFDYLGVPTGIASLVVSALPVRAYQLIFKEWYRDQDLVTAPTISTASGTDSTTSTSLQRIAWEKDYFTSARPWTQKGPEVTIPLGDTAPVVSDGTNINVQNAAGTTGDRRLIFGSDAENEVSYEGATVAGQPFIKFGTNTGLETDLSGATAADINSLRLAFALQRYEEARARYGSRYSEYLRYLGIRSSDARLQRPEYLGGGKQTIQFSEVLQSAPGTDSVVGEMKGHGIGALRSNRYRRFFEEHGYVITMMSVRPKTIYAQGLPRTWNRRTKEDFYQKELAHIGQQPVLNKEVYAAHATPDGTFAYQDRYDDYRRMESSISGEFRTTLDFWHMARIFSSTPALNSSFVQCDPTDRIYADADSHELLVMANHSVQARRMVPPAGNSLTY